MNNTLYAIIGACLSMLVTSGIVAYATAAPSSAAGALEQPAPPPDEPSSTASADAERYVGQVLSAQYDLMMARASD
jgi:hypothetical protein